MASNFPVAGAAVSGSAVVVSLSPAGRSNQTVTTYEVNPFRPHPPEAITDLSPDIADYFDEQASLLREQFETITAGVTFRPVTELEAVYTEERFPLGTRANFFSDVGQVGALFVRFVDMSPTDFGSPVGLHQDPTARTQPNMDSPSPYVVTNRFESSNGESALGFLPQGSTPADGEYGWIVIDGPNVQPVRSVSVEATTQGTEVGWTGTGVVSAVFNGVKVATQLNSEARNDTAPYEPGELRIAISSSVGTAPVAELTQVVSEISARVDSTSASLTAVQEVFAAADEALSREVGLLEVRVGEIEGLAANERFARIAQGEALIQSVQTLEANVGEDIAASVVEVTTAFVNGDRALSERIDLLAAQFQDTSADQSLSLGQIQQQVSVLTDGNTATTRKFAQLQSEVETIDFTGVSQAITDLTTRVTENENGIDANAMSITALNTSLTNLDGTVSAQATAINSLETTVIQNGADISAQATQVSQLSANVTTLSGTVSGFSSDISNIQGDINGIESRRTIRVGANNTVTGIELISGSGDVSIFRVQADIFEVVNSAGQGQSPFRVSGGTTFIENAVIQNLSIATDKMANRSITASSFSQAGAAQTLIPLNSDLTKGTVNVTLASQTLDQVIVQINCNLIFQNGRSNIEMRVVDGNGQVRFASFATGESHNSTSPLFRPTTFFARYFNPTRGPYTVRFRRTFSTSGATARVSTVDMLAITLKK